MYRNRVSSFDHAQLLTHGNPIGLSALAARLNDAAAGSADAVCTSDDEPLFARVQHYLGERSAHLTFITPEPEDSHPGLPALLDFLCIRSGEMGAVNLLAEVRESGQMLETFRHCCFNIYGWETIWRLPMKSTLQGSANSTFWKRITNGDENAVRGLYHTLVPPLIQAAEPYYSNESNRLVYKKDGETLAFVERRIGSKGIYLIPVIHPSLENPEEMLADLKYLFRASGKPVYLQMRSYQAWLTTFLESMGAETTVHFALMSRRLAIPQYAGVKNHRLAIENRRAETSAPIINKISHFGE